MTKKAQSTFELIAVITFVTVVVFFIGPTVIRSVNAHFQLWDDSVHDSYSDPLQKADEQTLPTTCVCTGWQGGAGLRCQASPCLPTERLVSISCNPSNCGTSPCIPSGPNERCINNFEKCVVDSTCCGIMLDTDLCCLGPTSAVPTNCPVGDRVLQGTCGFSAPLYGSRPDPDGIEIDGNVSCTPQCLGDYAANELAASAVPYYPVICPGDDSNFPDDSPWQLDDRGIGLQLLILGTGSGVCNRLNPDIKCESYCLPPYEPKGGICQPPSCPAPIRAIIHVCDDDFYNSVVAALQPTTGGACSRPSDNGGVVCSAEGGVLRSGDSGKRCPDLGATQVPVEAGDIITLYHSDRGNGKVIFNPNADCTAGERELSTAVNPSGATMVIPRNGVICNSAFDDNIATTLVRGFDRWTFKLNEKNTLHHRILGPRENCTIRCTTRTSGNSSITCSVTKALTARTFNNVIPLDTCPTCCYTGGNDARNGCVNQYFTTQTVQPGDWYTSFSAGANDFITSALVSCEKDCCREGEIVRVDTRDVVEAATGWAGRYIVTNDDFRGGGVDGAPTLGAMENICQLADPQLHAISENTANYACITAASDEGANRHNGAWQQGYCNSLGICEGFGWCPGTTQAVEWVNCQRVCCGNFQPNDNILEFALYGRYNHGVRYDAFSVPQMENATAFNSIKIDNTAPLVPGRKYGFLLLMGGNTGGYERELLLSGHTSVRIPSRGYNYGWVHNTYTMCTAPYSALPLTSSMQLCPDNKYENMTFGDIFLGNPENFYQGTLIFQPDQALGYMPVISGTEVTTAASDVGKGDGVIFIFDVECLKVIMNKLGKTFNDLYP